MYIRREEVGRGQDERMWRGNEFVMMRRKRRTTAMRTRRSEATWEKHVRVCCEGPPETEDELN